MVINSWDITKIAGKTLAIAYQIATTSDYQYPAFHSIIHANIQGINTEALMDTGASISIISVNFARKLQAKFEPPRATATSVSGQPLHFAASARITVRLNGTGYTHRVHVMPDAPQDCLLGTDFMKRLGPITFDFEKGHIILNRGRPILLLTLDLRSTKSLREKRRLFFWTKGSIVQQL